MWDLHDDVNDISVEPSLFYIYSWGEVISIVASRLDIDSLYKTVEHWLFV